MMTDSNDRSSALISLSLAWALLFAPLVGCDKSESGGNETGELPDSIDTDRGMNVTESLPAVEGSDVVANASAGSAATESMFDEIWNCVSTTTSSGLTVVSETCSDGSQMVFDAGSTVWIYSKDRTSAGWDWISENAGNASEWASDTVAQTWAMTKQTGGEFSLWVQVRTTDGIAWAKTNLPAAWKCTKDAAGTAWVWVGEHKVEVALAAAVVTIVVAAIILAPETVGPSVARGAVTGSASHAATLLTDAWKNRNEYGEKVSLGDVSEGTFRSIGRSVLTQCGTQILKNLPVAP